MRKAILYIGMSLDGYIADARGGVDWMTGQNETEETEGTGETGDSYESFIKTVDTVIMGWNTYHQIITELSAGKWVYEGLTSWVITHRTKQSAKTAKSPLLFTDRSPCDLVKRLKKEEGKNIWICGGADIVRQLMGEDLEQVMKLWLNGNLEAHSFLPRKYWESHAEMVKEQLLCAEVLVYEEGGSVKGFAGLQGNYLAGIFVEGNSRSKGIGRALLDRVKETHLFFTLHVYAENARAAAFYRREGLQAVSRETEKDTGREEYTMEWRAPSVGTGWRAAVSKTE